MAKSFPAPDHQIQEVRSCRDGDPSQPRNPSVQLTGRRQWGSHVALLPGWLPSTAQRLTGIICISPLPTGKHAHCRAPLIPPSVLVRNTRANPPALSTALPSTEQQRNPSALAPDPCPTSACPQSTAVFSCGGKGRGKRERKKGKGKRETGKGIYEYVKPESWQS